MLSGRLFILLIGNRSRVGPFLPRKASVDSWRDNNFIGINFFVMFKYMLSFTNAHAAGMRRHCRYGCRLDLGFHRSARTARSIPTKCRLLAGYVCAPQQRPRLAHPAWRPRKALAAFQARQRLAGSMYASARVNHLAFATFGTQFEGNRRKWGRCSAHHPRDSACRWHM